jgi:signal transduction histidine kinase
MGIGLSLAEKIIRGHGGQLSVESRKGEGARFVINVPAWVDESKPVGAAAYGENTHS